jgi:hypothetical protein
MKTKVYSWRLSPDLKKDLERAGREEGVPVSCLLERLAQDWLEQRHREDKTEQARIRARAAKCIGSISLGGGPFTKDKIRKRVRERLVRKYGS